MLIIGEIIAMDRRGHMSIAVPDSGGRYGVVSGRNILPVAQPWGGGSTKR